VEPPPLLPATSACHRLPRRGVKWRMGNEELVLPVSVGSELFLRGVGSELRDKAIEMWAFDGPSWSVRPAGGRMWP
jgi:hypothetical protein